MRPEKHDPDQPARTEISRVKSGPVGCGQPVWPLFQKQLAEKIVNRHHAIAAGIGKIDRRLEVDDVHQ